jgi:uncharacterized membrane protein
MRLNVLIPGSLIAFSGAGLAVSAYLTVSHWGGQPLVCGGVGDCNYVNSSEYASVGGVPVSLLGGLLYLGMLAASGLWLLREEDERIPLVYWGLAVMGAGYALYLTYIELAVLHAICPWCVTSAVILCLCLGLSTWAILAAPGEGPVNEQFRIDRRARRGPAGRKRSRKASTAS